VTVTTDGEDMWEVFLRRLPANITYAVRVIPVNQYGRGKPSNTVSRNVTGEQLLTLSATDLGSSTLC